MLGSNILQPGVMPLSKYCAGQSVWWSQHITTGVDQSSWARQMVRPECLFKSSQPMAWVIVTVTVLGSASFSKVALLWKMLIYSNSENSIKFRSWLSTRYRCCRSARTRCGPIFGEILLVKLKTCLSVADPKSSRESLVPGAWFSVTLRNTHCSDMERAFLGLS